MTANSGNGRRAEKDAKPTPASVGAPSDGNTDAARYVSLARFFAENISVQAGALERTVTESAESVAAADAVLLG